MNSIFSISFFFLSLFPFATHFRVRHVKLEFFYGNRSIEQTRTVERESHKAYLTPGKAEEYAINLSHFHLWHLGKRELKQHHQDHLPPLFTERKNFFIHISQ